MQLAGQASALLWCSSQTVQAEQGALLHSFCLDGVSGTAEVVHGEAAFVQPACLCQVLRGSTSQPPLMERIHLMKPSRAQHKAVMWLPWKSWSHLKVFMWPPAGAVASD